MSKIHIGKMNKLKTILIVLVLLTSISFPASASLADDITNSIKGAIQALGVSTPSQICAVDSVTGQPVYMTAMWDSTTASKALGYLNDGYSEGSGTCIGLNWYTGYSIGIAARAIGYQDATWSGTSTSYIQIAMTKIATPAPQPAPVITPAPTAIIPGATTPPPAPIPDIILIPPSVTKFLASISSWLTSWLFGLSITGGSATQAPINVPYTATVSEAFATGFVDCTNRPPTATYCESKTGNVIVMDENKKVLLDSGWSAPLTASPYTKTISFTPTSPGNYIIVAGINRQTYNYTTDAGWKLTSEGAETKEVQNIAVTIPNPQVQTPPAPLAWIGTLLPALHSLLPSLF